LVGREGEGRGGGRKMVVVRLVFCPACDGEKRERRKEEGEGERGGVLITPRMGALGVIVTPHEREREGGREGRKDLLELFFGLGVHISTAGVLLSCHVAGYTPARHPVSSRYLQQSRRTTTVHAQLLLLLLLLEALHLVLEHDDGLCAALAAPVHGLLQCEGGVPDLLQQGAAQLLVLVVGLLPGLR
jgi:hypothetical protein